MTNIIAVLGLLVKLIPFLKEVFIKNKDFRDAIIHNKSLLAIFVACSILFTVNLDHIDNLVENQHRIKELTRGFEEVKLDYDVMSLEMTQLQLTVQSQQSKVHGLEVSLAKAEETIKLREERIAELKETVKTLRENK